MVGSPFIGGPVLERHEVEVVLDLHNALLPICIITLRSCMNLDKEHVILLILITVNGNAE